MMEIKDFFDFGSAMMETSFQVGAVELGRDEDGINDHDNLMTGKYGNINFPVVFKHDYGKKITDILDTGWPNLYLISDRLMSILEDHKLTGWKTFPIKLYDKKKNEILGYQGFSVVGRCGPIDNRKSEIIEKRRCPTCPVFKAYKGLHVGLDKWDGSDFFIPEKSLFFIVTRKAAEILKASKITNMELENLMDMERSIYEHMNENKSNS